MPDIVHVTYGQTGQSIQTNNMGMRDRQARAFAARDAQYLLIKAPPGRNQDQWILRTKFKKGHGHPGIGSP